jgi:hypothetical protein
MHDPNRLGHEFSLAWKAFKDAGGLTHALRVRYDQIVGSFLPVNVVRNFATLPAGCDCITNAEIWFTIHDRTIPGMILYVMCPFALYGVYRWWRTATWEPLWMLAAPFVLALIFWGVAARGLGSDLLQPLGALLMVIAAGGLAAARRPLALAAVALAIGEAATVVWWGLFSRLAGASPAELAITFILWSLPCALLAGNVFARQDVDARWVSHSRGTLAGGPATR